MSAPERTSGRLLALAVYFCCCCCCWLAACQPAEALRGGAPALACNSLRPFHGLHRAKPASASQFFVSQSALSYAPNESVTVEITTHSSERFFRGFLVQAYDPANGKRFGKFLPSEQAQPVHCSAATHRDHADKRYVALKWLESTDFEGAGQFGGEAAHNSIDTGEGTGAAPNNTGPRKQVRFRATIVVTYGEFYTEFESSERNFAKWDFSNTTRRGQTLA